MTDDGPLAIIDRFAKAVERHPEALPLTPEEREAVRRVAIFYMRLDALAWAFGCGVIGLDHSSHAAFRADCNTRFTPRAGGALAGFQPPAV